MNVMATINAVLLIINMIIVAIEPNIATATFTIVSALMLVAVLLHP